MNRTRIAWLLALSLLLPATSWAGGARGRKIAPAARKHAVVIETTPKTVVRERNANSKLKTALTGAKRSTVNVTTFGNNEVSVRVPQVAGKDVYVTQAADGGAHGIALFRTVQAVEASHMGRARSVRVRMDERVSSWLGRDFVEHLLSATPAERLDHVGDGGTRSARLTRRSAVKTSKARRGRAAAQRPLLWGGASHQGLLASLGKRVDLAADVVDVDRGGASLEVTLPEDPAGRDVYLLQSKRLTSPEQFHDDMLDMLKIAYEAKKAGAGEITAIMPYLPYSRSDRMDAPGISVGAAVLPKLMKQVGISRVIFDSVHQPQELGIFQALNMQVVHAAGESILARRTAQEIRREGVKPEDLVVVAPDAGAEKRARVFAKFLAGSLGVDKLPVVTANKERKVNEIELRFNADIGGKVAVAIDDETASGSTLNELARAAGKGGARGVYAAVSHLTGPAYERIDGTAIRKLFVLDTLPQERTKAAGNRAIEVVSIANHLGQLVRRLEKDQRVDHLLFLEHP